MVIFFLLSLAFAESLSKRVLWSLDLDFSPQAVFYEVSKDRLLVGYEAGIAEVSAQGVLQKKAWSKEATAVRAMRSYAGVLGAINAQELFLLSLETGHLQKKYKIPALSLVDIAVGSQGEWYLADSVGKKVWIFTQGKATEYWSLKEAPRAVLHIGDILYVATEEGIWQKNTKTLESKKLRKQRTPELFGLERGPEGTFYFLTRGSLQSTRKKNLLRLDGPGADFAYVYRRESVNDFLVLPEAKKLRAVKAQSSF